MAHQECAISIIWEKKRVQERKGSWGNAQLGCYELTLSTSWCKCAINIMYAAVCKALLFH